MVTGHTAAHSAIKGNVAVALDEALKLASKLLVRFLEVVGKPPRR
jgi:hypothetical protein